jgi:hypothetical protein
MSLDKIPKAALNSKRIGGIARLSRQIILVGNRFNQHSFRIGRGDSD